MTIPDPQPGLVLSYAYLWQHEHLTGQEEGIKERPAVIVLTTRRASDASTMVTVLPVSHRPPADPDWAIELPTPLKRHLGLDDGRSWIVVAEGNEFLWPGFDLRKITSADRYDYGFLPPRFFDKVLAAFAAFHRSGKGRLTPRG